MKGGNALTVEKSVADTKLLDAYANYSADIIKYCNLRLRENKSALDDCIQDIFLVYYNKILSGEEILNVRAFLYRTADNICKKAENAFLRNAKKTVALDSAVNVAAAEYDEKAASIDYDLLKDILLKKLTVSEQELYILKYAENKSLKEIADSLNLPLSTVAKRTSRLRAKIKGLITPIIEEYGEGGVAP